MREHRTGKAQAKKRSEPRERRPLVQPDGQHTAAKARQKSPQDRQQHPVASTPRIDIDPFHGTAGFADDRTEPGGENHFLATVESAELGHGSLGTESVGVAEIPWDTGSRREFLAHAVTHGDCPWPSGEWIAHMNIEVGAVRSLESFADDLGRVDRFDRSLEGFAIGPEAEVVEQVGHVFRGKVECEVEIDAAVAVLRKALDDDEFADRHVDADLESGLREFDPHGILKNGMAEG